MIKKSAFDIINIKLIEKEAGLADFAKTVASKGKDIGGETLKDVKRATGFEKFIPKHDVSSNALKGALGGAAVGGASAMATNSGNDKDNFGAALKGSALGALGGAALGGGASHKLNNMDASAFKGENSAFKRGFGLGTTVAGTATSVGKDGVQKAYDYAKSKTPDSIKKNLVGVYDKVKGKADDFIDATKSKGDKVVNNIKDKAREIDKDLSGVK